MIRFYLVVAGRKTTPALNDIDLMKSMKGIMMAGSGM